MYASVGEWVQLLRQGAWIRVWTDHVYHHGIYVGNGEVIHARKGHGVVRAPLGAFSCGKPVEIVRAPSNSIHCSQILRRSQSCLGTPYHLFDFNCEHFASWAWGEQPHSEQLVTAVLVTVGIGVTCLAMRRG